MLDADFSPTKDSQQPLLNRLRDPRARVSLGTLCGMISLALYVGYKAGFLKARQDDANYILDTQITKDVSPLQRENAQLKEKLTSLERDYQLQMVAKKNLEDHLKGLQYRNTELTQEVTLYQSLMGTAPIQGAQIKAFRSFSTQDARTYRYAIMLSQSAARRDVQGLIKMTVLGKMGNKAIRLPVKYVDSGQAEGLGFKFRHFQELTGELTFPEQFIPEEVLLQVTQKGGNTFKQQFPWTD